MLQQGVCREQARCILPVAMYSQAIWTLSLQAAVHVIRLRTSEHAQAETREYGHAISKICMDLWPLATTALLEHLPEVK
jgi:thymidylate synthase (FAD)